MNIFQQYIAKSRYARYLPEKKRREHFDETVMRYIKFITEVIDDKYFTLDLELKEELFNYISSLKVMPSMRALMTAGKALSRDNTCGYNCSYLPIDDIKSFDEAMFILMCGTGVGFSVERQYINQLPEIPEKLFDSDTVIIVKDSKEGWAKSLRILIALLYSGEIPKWDLSKIRPAGTPLKVFGGRASGPQVLEDLFVFVVKVFKKAIGRKLTSIECHDLMCKIAEIVVVGGVRRCLPEYAMIHTKNGMIPIKDIKMGDMVLTTHCYHPVVNIFNNGKKEIIKIITQDGYFECTPEHKVAILSNEEEYIWKQAKDLKENDRVIAPSISIEGAITQLPDFEYDYPEHCTVIKDIIIPPLNNDIAWILGYIQGNGYIHLTSKSGQVISAIPNNYPDILEKYVRIIKSFGVNYSILEYENYKRINVKSKQLATYFNSWLKKPNVALSVPEFIWKSSYEIKMNFVAGLMDADGSVKNRPSTVVVTIYEQYAREIQLLLSSCGIQTRLKKCSDKGLKENWKKKWAVVIINNVSKHKLNEFGIKKCVINNKLERCTNTYPKHFSKSYYPVDYPWSKTNNILIPVKVVKIEYNRKEENTYDLEIENMHEFFCDGYLVHNSALISLSNLSDERMRQAKVGQWWLSNPQRALSNNSAVYTEKPEVGIFMEEWLALYQSKSGERGIFSRDAARKVVAKNTRREVAHEWGCNPCVIGNTRILTKDGYQPIVNLIGEEVEIWNGQEFSTVKPFYIGKKRIFEVNLSNGVSLYCTGNHKFIIQPGLNGDVNSRIEVRDLKPGMKLVKYSMPVIKEGIEYDFDAYSQGFYSGGGYTSRLTGKISSGMGEDRKIWTHGKMQPKDWIPLDATLSFKLNWLSGLLNADSCVTRDKNGNGLQLVSMDLEFLKELRLFLTTLGVQAKIVHASDERYARFKEDQKEYLCKKTKRILIGNQDTYNLIKLGIKFNRLQVHDNPPQRDTRQFVKIVSVIDTKKEEDVFCFNEPINHTGTFEGIVTGQCSEILLRPYEKCNLSEVVVRTNDTEETLIQKIKIATILGTFQSTLTHFPYLRKIWQKNAEEERLLGVSLTGIYDNLLMNNIHDLELPARLERLKQIAIDTNKEWAEKLGINQSCAITCCKPSGTVSTLVDCASGIHPRHSKYYYRRVRSDNKDPLTKFLIEQKIPNEPDVMKPEFTTIFTFPIKAPEDSLTKDDISAIDHLELWLIYQRHWAEHKPSVTISVKDYEWPRVGAWVYDHFDEMSGVSFLPYNGGTYRQAPYESITQEQYEKSIEKIQKNINWDDLIERIDNVEGVQTLGCSSGGCEV